jgi:alanyl-tRNA synthetase
VPSSSLLPDSPNLLFTNAGMNQFVPIFLSGRTSANGPVPSPASIRARTPRSASAPAASTMTSRTWASTPITTRSSRCSATGASAIISRRRPSIGRGNSSSALEISRTVSTPRLQSRPRRPERVRPGGVGPMWLRSLPARPRCPHRQWQQKGQLLDDGRHRALAAPARSSTSISPPTATCRPKLVNSGSPECIEIWNLVFIQFNANPDGSLHPAAGQARGHRHGLRARHLDDPVHKSASRISPARISNYETDVFRPIFRRNRETQRKRNTLPRCPLPAKRANEQEKIDVAFRVIADHIRCLSFAIADGIQPAMTAVATSCAASCERAMSATAAFFYAGGFLLERSHHSFTSANMG